MTFFSNGLKIFRLALNKSKIEMNSKLEYDFYLIIITRIILHFKYEICNELVHHILAHQL